MPLPSAAVRASSGSPHPQSSPQRTAASLPGSLQLPVAGGLPPASVLLPPAPAAPASPPPAAAAAQPPALVVAAGPRAATPGRGHTTAGLSATVLRR